MKRKLTILVGLAAVFLTSSCKKQTESLETETFKRPQSVMTLPGQSNTESYLVPQPNGQYKAAWQGDMTFGDNPHPIVNVVNGTPIDVGQIINVNNEYLEIMTVGPYFTVIRPTFVGSVGLTREKFNEFAKEYDNFINNKRDTITLQLLQPTLPNLNAKINMGNGTGQIVVTGMLVSSVNSPSKMAIVSADFVPPAYAAPVYMLLPEYVRGDINYDIAGDEYGNIREVTAFNITTGQPVFVQSFIGTYTQVPDPNNAPYGTITTVDLKIWTSPNTFFVYQGTL